MTPETPHAAGEVELLTCVRCGIADADVLARNTFSAEAMGFLPRQAHTFVHQCVDAMLKERQTLTAQLAEAREKNVILEGAVLQYANAINWMAPTDTLDAMRSNWIGTQPGNRTANRALDGLRAIDAAISHPEAAR